MDRQTQLSKIEQTHLKRSAYIYVRQSSLYQVKFNTASTARQYNLTERALELGWTKDLIVVVDQDQGQTGSSTDGRNGFKQMLAEILNSKIGAVISLEASRLARDCSDWHLLIKMCALTNTLIIDEFGIHNPRIFDDRLLLGLKGTLGEAELHLIGGRLHGARLERARDGTLRYGLSAGYLYNPEGTVIIDPTPGVKETVNMFFEQFGKLGTCMETVRYFRKNELLVPAHIRNPAERERTWVPLNYSRARKWLHNPIYAGMYVYGRSRTDMYVLPGVGLETANRRVLVPAGEWSVCIPDAHEAYISETQYWANLKRLRENRTFELNSPGAPNRGAALLQGIVRCGACGRAMSVKYPGKHRNPVYECHGSRQSDGSTYCQFVAATRVDAKITDLFLQAVAPAQYELSMQAFDQMENEVASLRKQWQVQLEEAEKDAVTAARLFKQAALQNRHVACQLQNEWEEALQRLEKIKAAGRSLPVLPSQYLSESDKQRILNLATDLPGIWSASSTKHEDRKELIRLLIKDVVLVRIKDSIHTTVRWQTGARLEVSIPWLSFPESHRSQPEVLQIIRQMSPTHTDQQIADHLNSLGYVRRWRSKFDWHSITDIRRCNNIKHECPERFHKGKEGPRGDGRYSIQQIMKILNLPRHTINKWCIDGKLDANRSTLTSPWWIKLTPETIAELKR